MHAKSVLITGGAGFIGTHLARAILQGPSQPKVVSIDICAPRKPVTGVRYLAHDVRRPFDETLDEHFDVVFNLAAVHRTPGHADAEYFETNIAGAKNTVTYCAERRIQTIVFTSSIAAYGPSEAPLTEESPLAPTIAYGKSKLEAEIIHREWLDLHRSRRLAVVRPAVIFGEGEQGNFTRLARLLQRGMFIYPGRKDTRKACGYVKDLIRSMAFALDRPEREYIYNFTGKTCPTIEEICETFGSVANVRRPFAVVPASLMRTGAMTFEMLNRLGLRNEIDRQRINKLLYSTYIIPQRLIDDGYRFGFDLRSGILDWMQTDKDLTITPKVKLAAAPRLEPFFDQEPMERAQTAQAG